MFYAAIYTPAKTKKIDPLAEKFIGNEIIIQSGWIARKGRFKGQLCYVSGFNTTHIIPESDLKGLKPSSLCRWNEFRDNIKYYVNVDALKKASKI
jgi:hypothetical protein